MVHRGDLGETVASFVSEHYANRRPPRLLLTPTPLLDGIEEWLCTRRKAKVEVRTPLRGDLVTLLTLARQNADIQMTRLANATSGSLEQRAANDGAGVLGMDQLNHIVCFDMAQLLGDERVGASVTFRNGRPAKKEYRTYIVKSEAMDDLRMMSEVVERWLKRQDTWPDLLLIDGGETHLSTITRLLKEHDVLDKFALAALAKREETIFRNGHEPIILDRKGRVMVHARDEAHRFAIQAHRKKKHSSSKLSQLSMIPGIGPILRARLFKKFRTISSIKKATILELIDTDGISITLAKTIIQELKKL